MFQFFHLYLQFCYSHHLGFCILILRARNTWQKWWVLLRPQNSLPSSVIIFQLQDYVLLYVILCSATCISRHPLFLGLCVLHILFLLTTMSLPEWYSLLSVVTPLVFWCYFIFNILSHVLMQISCQIAMLVMFLCVLVDPHMHSFFTDSNIQAFRFIFKSTVIGVWIPR